MSRSRLGGLWVVLFFFLIVASVAAWGEVTLHNDGGEAQWWYYGEHDEVCGDDGDYCIDSDHWGIELATYFEDDWAYVGLNVARRFVIGDVGKNNIGFYYTMVVPPYCPN